MREKKNQYNQSTNPFLLKMVNGISLLGSSSAVLEKVAVRKVLPCASVTAAWSVML